MNWLAFIFRWLHLIAAMTAVGGTIFMRFALVPSVSVLSDEQRSLLHAQVRSRWAKLVMASIGFLLLSGLVNYVLFLQTSKTEPWEGWRQTYNGLYQGIFGMKFTVALVIFFIASALSGRSGALKVFRDNAKYWMTVNVILAMAVVALSGVLRITHAGPTLPAAASTGQGTQNSTITTGEGHG
jgi:uncharacterized membrane protein